MDRALMQTEAQTIISEISAKAGAGKRIVFVSGNFNIVHPGHLRLLNFAAECGDFLAVGVYRDDAPGVHLPQDLRIEGVAAIGSVGHAFLLPMPAEEFIAALKPALVVKGKEHETRFNPEQSVVDSYGGQLLFSSGDARFSSIDLLQRELRESNQSAIRKPADYPARHDFDMRRLAKLVRAFSSQRVVVIGDLIVDEYIACDPLGMSQEDPTIVVTPIRHDLFVGGAGIVAAHAHGLGAQVEYFGVCGSDSTAEFAQESFAALGVSAHLVNDISRPTTLKQRYRARGKTLLRVSHLRQHDIGQELIASMLGDMEAALSQADLVVFSDFNYGCLPQGLVDAVTERCVARGIPMVADSQSSSQIGDVSRFRKMLLLTPTEHEARLAMRGAGDGLVVLAEALRVKAEATHVFITLGAEGLLMQTRESQPNGLTTDRLPAFNDSPKDVSGAGDCLLISAALALVAGGTLWESAYLGSVAAACQVGRVGNLPLGNEELLRELSL